jgi:hypothetical protein
MNSPRRFVCWSTSGRRQRCHSEGGAAPHPPVPGTTAPTGIYFRRAGDPSASPRPSVAFVRGAIGRGQRILSATVEPIPRQRNRLAAGLGLATGHEQAETRFLSRRHTLQYRPGAARRLLRNDNHSGQAATFVPRGRRRRGCSGKQRRAAGKVRRCWLFPIPYSLFPIPYSLFPLPTVPQPPPRIPAARSNSRTAAPICSSSAACRR